MSSKRRGHCSTCGQHLALVRQPGAAWPSEFTLINDHKSPSPVFGPVTKRCPGALQLPWGAPPPPKPEMPGQSSIMEVTP